MTKTDTHWCGTCIGLRRLLELATEKIKKMSDEEKADFRREVRQQFGIPESDTDFLKQCGIDPEG